MQSPRHRRRRVLGRKLPPCPVCGTRIERTSTGRWGKHTNQAGKDCPVNERKRG